MSKLGNNIILTERELILFRELKRRQKEEPIRFWNPHHQQLKFLTSKAKTRIVLGGNRSGKSEAGCVEAVSQCLGYRPYLPKDHPAYKTELKIPCKGRICGEDYRNHIGNVIIPKLRQWIPRRELKDVKKNPQGVEVLWVFRNGSTLELMTYEQDSDKFEGADTDFIWFDEPPPRQIYVAAYRGLVDRGGRCWFTMTPLKEPWIKNELWDKQNKPGFDVDGFIFDINDNIGFGLTDKNVKDFEQILSPDEIEARLRGRFMHLSGLVYKQFDYATHVVKPFEIPPDWSIYVAIDPHPRTPHAVLFMAVAPDGSKYVFDELFRACLVEELCAFIKAKLAGKRPRVILIDPASTAPNPVSGLTVQKEFTKHGIYTIKASKELSAGILRVQKALKKGPNGMPEVFIFSSCKETISEFNNYVWDEYKGKARFEKSEKNSPRDKDDHMMENLYRLLIMNPTYQPLSKMSFEEREEYQPRNLTTGY